MGKKKPSKAKKRVRALKRAEPSALISDETDWSQFEPEDLKRAPHTFVIYRGKVGRYMKELMKDIRKVMEPFTATNLKMKKGNVLKDYVSIASYFNVTHLCILTRTQVSPYFKVCKIPRGPTLTFRILNYTLARDVRSSLRKQVTFEAQFLHQPLLIMNNFSSESKTLDLISKTFQNMFPSINVNKIRLGDIRRVLLLNYLDEDDTIELRHYAITFKTTGVSRGIKKILISKNGKIPNLGRCTDIADFFNRDGEVSESEAEDTTETVGVNQKMGVKISKGLEEVGIKLVELGPRMKMQLIKVEEGLCDGEVLYHKIVEKTPEEKLFIRQQRNLKKRMKMARKKEQEMNVERKKKEKLEHKEKCLEGMGIADKMSHGKVEEEDDDADWYRKEVGEDPDEDTFSERRPKGKFSQGRSSEGKFSRGRSSEGRFSRGGSSEGKFSRGGSSEDKFSRGRKRKFDDGDRDGRDQPFKRGKVSKFAKVKEKAKLLKKERQREQLGAGGRMKSKSKFPVEGGGRPSFSAKKGNYGRGKPKGSKGSKKKVVARTGSKPKRSAKA